MEDNNSQNIKENIELLIIYDIEEYDKDIIKIKKSKFRKHKILKF